MFASLAIKENVSVRKLVLPPKRNLQCLRHNTGSYINLQILKTRNVENEEAVSIPWRQDWELRDINLALALGREEAMAKLG